MATPTIGIGLQKPTIQGDKNAWGPYLNSDMDTIAQVVSGANTTDCAGNVDVTLTAAQANWLVQQTTGLLTGSVKLLIPARVGFWLVDNQCTGAFTVSAGIAPSGTGTVVACAAGAQTLVFSQDGVNIIAPSQATVTGQMNWCGTSTDSPNQQLITPATAVASLVAGQYLFAFLAGFTNTTAMTLGVSGAGGYQPFYKPSAAGPVVMTGGEIVAGNLVGAIWDGSQFQKAF